MRSSLLRTQTLPAYLCAALATASAGCAGATTTGSTITGSTLKVYASQPPHGAGGQGAQDVLDAERLALQQVGGQVGHFKVLLEPVTGAKISDEARSAIADSSTIAYLGDVAQHSSSDSIGITSGVGVLQVSPVDTAIELTQPTKAVSNSPTRYYASIKTHGRTFGRVVPMATREAAVQVQALRGIGARHLYVADDGGAYGSAVALALSADASAAGISVTRGAADVQKLTASGADALFMGASGQGAAAALFNRVATASPKVHLFAPSALAEASAAAGLSAAAQRSLVVSQPGFIETGPKADIPPLGRKFIADFNATYHRTPEQPAIFGYEAMALVLDVLRRAGANAPSRSAVVSAFHSTKDRPSVLGTYSIDVSGDTSLAPYVLSHFEAGKLVPFQSMQG